VIEYSGTDKKCDTRHRETENFLLTQKFSVPLCRIHLDPH